LSDIDPNLLPFIGSDDGPSLADVVLTTGIVTTAGGAGLATLKNPKAVASVAGSAGRAFVKFGKGNLAKGLGGLALGVTMNTASATAAEKAGMDANTGRSLNAMVTLGLNSFVQKGMIDTTGGRLASKLFQKGLVAPANEVSKLSKLKTTMAAMAGGAMIGNIAVEAIATHTDWLTGFGASREQTAAHVKDFSRLHLTESVSIPNIDPVTSVLRTVEAFEDLSEANQERGHHGDKFLDKAIFAGKEIGEKISDETGSQILGVGAGLADGTVVGLGEVITEVVDTALDVALEPTGALVGAAAREVLDFLTPW